MRREKDEPRVRAWGFCVALRNEIATESTENTDPRTTPKNDVPPPHPSCVPGLASIESERGGDKQQSVGRVGFSVGSVDSVAISHTSPRAYGLYLKPHG